MNRTFKREDEEPEGKPAQTEDASRTEGAAAPAAAPAKRKERTSPRVFLREVRGEMRRVAWPSRREVASYSIVVLVSVTLITAYIFGLDQLFGQFVLTIFGES